MRRLSPVNSIVKYALQPKVLDGMPDLSRHRYDLMNIVMIGMPRNMPKSGEHDLHRFIMILLSGEIELEEKKELLQDDYNIPMTESAERRILGMCNFSDEIWENGKKAGMEVGMEAGTKVGILSMIDRFMEAKNLSLEEACEIAGITTKEYAEMKEKNI